jgi:NAD(P)H dehydrogenase (quinone)
MKQVVSVVAIFFLLSVFGVVPIMAQTSVLIVYHSKTGNTARMAQAVYEGAAAVEGVQVVLKPVDQVSIPDLLDADAIIVGSPVYNANVTPEIQRFIAGWPFEGMPLKDKVGAAFVTAGGISAGEEITQMNILQSMLIYGLIVVGGPDWKSPFGASAIVGEPPFENKEGISSQFLEKAHGLGMRVALLAKRLE